MGMHSKLETLVQISQKLNQDVEIGQLPDEIPKIRRNPRQLYEESISLSRKSTYDERIKNKAQSSMAQKGYDLDKLQRAFDAIKMKQNFEQNQSQSTDLETYLTHKQESLLIASIEGIKKEATDRFFYIYNNYMNEEWESTKHELIEFFSQRENMHNYDIEIHNEFMGFDQFSRGVINTGSPEITRKMLKYLQIVKSLNNRNSESKEKYNFSSECERGILELDEYGSERDILTCWQIIDAIFTDKISTLSKVEQKWTLLKNSRMFLEKQYNLHIRSEVTQKLPKSKVKPTLCMKSWLTAYLNILFPHGPPEKYECIPSGQSLWGLIYYALRCGDIETATEIAQSNPSSQSIVPFIAIYTQNRDRGYVSDDLRAQIIQEYRKNKSTHDPFKRIVYNILGRCEPNRSYNDIVSWSTEDFIWLLLNMVSVVSEDITTSNVPSSKLQSPYFKSSGTPKQYNSEFTPNSDTQSNVHTGHSIYTTFRSSPTTHSIRGISNDAPLSLTQFQNTLYDLGIDHFHRPILYFQVLLLSLQFERALTYLESCAMFPVDVVHFSLALYRVGALELPSDPLNAPISGQENGKPFFNVIKQLKKYASTFVVHEICETFNYLLVIQDERIRHQLIKDLVLETGAFSKLLGSIGQDGTRTSGYIEGYVTKEQWKDIVQLAANDSEQKGKYDDAIYLYNLSEDRINSMQLISKQLGQVLTSNSLEKSRFVNLAETLNKKYPDPPSETGMHEAQKIYQSFTILLNLAHFFDSYHQMNYKKALETLKKTQLLPFKNTEVESRIFTLKSLDNNIKRNFSEILLAAMNCLYKIFIEVKNSDPIPERENYLVSLKQEAKTIEMFTGLIEFQIPGETPSKLVRIEAEMI